ncbi:MAG TPA: SOS response-associated peptidase [Balneolales bacterium]|nr:SOS response-associated peptidase [Balneolales bacterium]
MCGRYTLFSDKEEIEETFGVSSDENELFKVNYNVAPGTINPVILMPRPDVRDLGGFKWGLIPSWAEDERVGYKMINARAETLLEKPSYRKPFQRQRCIIPANGFFEWQTIYKQKTPFYVRTLDQDLLGFAGLYEKWVSKDKKKTVYSYTIITTEANALLQPLHDRMPVILERKNYDQWLDPVNSDTEELNKMINPYPTERMAIYRVSQDVNDAKNNGPELIQPVDA